MRPPETPRRPDAAQLVARASAASGAFSEPRPRKPYRRPRLAAYGHLTDVTRFGGSEVVDSGGGLGQNLGP